MSVQFLKGACCIRATVIKTMNNGSLLRIEIDVACRSKLLLSRLCYDKLNNRFQ